MSSSSTPLRSGFLAEAKHGLVALDSIGCRGRTEEVADSVGWLSFEKTPFVTSSYYPVDGGYPAR